MRLRGRVICRGSAEGEALVTSQPISFYGGVDPDTGVVVERGHELRGRCVKDRVLVFPCGRGSTVGSYALYRMKKRGVSPSAIINKDCETIVAVGAIISGIPCVDKVEIEKIENGSRVRVEGALVEW